jgi:hypothetical protein
MVIGGVADAAYRTRCASGDFHAAHSLTGVAELV